MFPIEPPQPVCLFWTVELRLGFLRHHEVEVEMTSPRGIGFLRFHQPVLRVLPNRLEHPIAWFGACQPLHHDEGLVDQPRQSLQDLEVAATAAHVRRAFERPTVGEHRQHPKQTLLFGGKKVMAPLDGREQRLVTW